MRNDFLPNTADADLFAALIQHWQASFRRQLLARRCADWPDSLYRALVRLGRAKEAQDYAAQISDPERRHAVLLLIAAELPLAAARSLWRLLVLRASHLPNLKDRVYALCDIVAVMAQVGHPELPTLAERAARQIAALDTALRPSLYAALADGLSGLDDLTAAWDALNKIDMPQFKAGCLLRLTERLAQSQRVGAAELTSALIEEPDVQTQAVIALIAAYAAQGDLAAVGRLLERLPQQRAREQAYARSAPALAQAGLPALAQAMALAIAEPLLRAQALAALALGLAADDLATSRAMAATAYQTAQDIADVRQRCEAEDAALAALLVLRHPQSVALALAAWWGDCAKRATPALACAAVGALDWAYALNPALVIDPDWTVSAASIAAMRKYGWTAAVLACAQTRTDPGAQSALLLPAVQALLADHDYTAAQSVALRIPLGAQRVQALAGVAEALAAAQPAEALALLDQALSTPMSMWDEPCTDDQELQDLAAALAVAGAYDSAYAAALLIDHPLSQATALAALLPALIRAEHSLAERCLALAWRSADALAQSHRRFDPLLVLVRALAEAGWAMHAEMVSRSIDDRFLSGQALAACATSYVRLHRPELACAVAARAADMWAELLVLSEALLATGAAVLGTALRAKARQLDLKTAPLRSHLWAAAALVRAGDGAGHVLLEAVRQRIIKAPSDAVVTPELLKTVALLQAQVGLIDAARETVQLLTMPPWQAAGLAAVANVLFEAQHPAALAWLLDARAAVLMLEPGHARAALISSVAQLAARSGQAAAAQALAPLAAERDRINVWREIIAAHLRAGATAEARRIIASQWARSDDPGRIVLALPFVERDAALGHLLLDGLRWAKALRASG